MIDLIQQLVDSLRYDIPVEYPVKDEGMNMKETFGQRFARLRKEKGLTQDDIAGHIGISAQAVSKWENDISSPDISAFADLADLLGVTTDVLLRKRRGYASGLNIFREEGYQADGHADPRAFQ